MQPGLAFFLHEPTDTIIITTIILISSLLGFWQEKGAADAFEKLLATVQIKAAVLRDGEEKEIPVEEIVPGDIIILNAGDMIPADCLILDSNDLFVSEATLTGETYPVEKTAECTESRNPACEAHKFSLDGNQRGQRQWKSAGSFHREGN